VPPSITRILDARGAGTPRLGPDASWLYYTTDLTGTQQLWRIAASGGSPQRLSFECDRVGAYKLSHSGARIAYAADSGGNEKWQIWLMDADGTQARRLTARADRIHHIVGWSPADDALYAFANLRHPLYFDLYRFATAGGDPALVVQRDGTGWGGTVLGDGAVVFTTNRGRMDKNHLELLWPDATVRRLTPEAPVAQHSMPHAFGDAVLVVSDRDREFQGVARIDRDGTYELLVEADHDVDTIAAAGEVWAYVLNCDGLSETHVVRGGHDEVLGGLPPGRVAGIDVAADGTVALSIVGYDSPGGIVVAREKATPRMAVPPVLAGLDASELPAHELVHWTSFDGLVIPGSLLRPRGADRTPRPTVIQVHGGPEGQARPVWNAITVALVARGFNVLQPNVRGSTGYGLRYQSLDDVRLRMGSVRDLDAAAAWLAASGTAPRDRIAVMGGSYGGFMTLAAIAFFPERGWAAAVDTVGIYNFRTFLERMDQWRRPLREAEYGSLEEDAEFLETIAPATRVADIRAPLMVIHGANDPRVPVHEAEQVVSALRARGHDVTYLRYEDEGHGLQKAKNRADAWPKVVEFLERHLTA
jgi:dipeptidyl aminopeptidase/acylaminoacyl peptidase